MKWIVTGFLALVFGVLSFNAFIANDLGRRESGNRVIAMLTDLYGWLLIDHRRGAVSECCSPRWAVVLERPTVILKPVRR
jgi:hypothetical protein